MNILELFAMLNRKFEGKKTYTTAIITILSAALAYFAGELTLFETLQLAIPAIMGAFVRHGLKTEGQTSAAVAIVSAEIAAGKPIEEIAGNSSAS